MTAAAKVVHHDAEFTAGVRERVPVDELSRFLGVHPIGPPFGRYYGMPGAEVDVEAGYPIDRELTPAGSVVPGVLPAGELVEATHVGPYETIGETYGEVSRTIGGGSRS